MPCAPARLSGTSPLTKYRHEGGGDISLDLTSCAGPAIACSYSMRIHADKKPQEAAAQYSRQTLHPTQPVARERSRRSQFFERVTADHVRARVVVHKIIAMTQGELA